MEALYPWYDSNWLSDYTYVKNFITENYPSKLAEFIEAFDPLRTHPDFNAIKFDQLIDEQTLEEIRSIIKNLQHSEKELHEFYSFGRLIVHDHPYFNQLHKTFVELVSEAVNEPVEPNYNFLCMYSNFGSCKVHMDSPEAKYTLDCCISQSSPWPIYFSQIQDWPEEFQTMDEYWDDKVFNNPEIKFSEYILKEREAVLFSGSGQWHYRNKIPKTTKKNFCHLVFFHFVPKGMKELVNPNNWGEIFKVPEIKAWKFRSNL